MRFSIVNLGCKVNRVESDDMAAELSAAGLVRDDSHPDVVVVNTCTVTGEAEKKTRKAVRSCLRAHPGASVIATGCAAAIDPDGLSSLGDRVVVAAKPQVVDVCRELLQVSEEELPNEPRLRMGEGYPTRVGIKAQDGCDNACTFCIVHVARGNAWSVPASEVVSAARDHERAGARELVLTGINLAVYKSDGLDLAGLLGRLRREAPLARLRIGSVEPRDVTDGLIDCLAGGDGMVCRHLHLPVQSGSSKVLREMARPYDAEQFLELVDRLYGRIPGLSLSTDIIVGFPGETEDDFRATLELVRQARFTKVHAFRYSRRRGTPAAARPDQVEPAVVAERAAELSALADHIRRQEALARVGSTERVLVEGDGKGMSESYFPVETGDLPRGALISARLAAYREDGVFTL